MTDHRNHSGGQGAGVPASPDDADPRRVYGVGDYSRDIARGWCGPWDAEEVAEVEADEVQYHEHLPHVQEQQKHQ